MARGNHDDDAVSSLSHMGETTATKRLQLTTSSGTLTSAPQLPTLPFELIEEILCRLPVKLLLQLRCLCKSFTSLISDPNFIKKHLHLSNHHHLIVSSTTDSPEIIFFDSAISSSASTSRVTQTQPSFSLKKLGYDNNTILAVCSCDGILCIASNDHLSAILWNPSVMKFKILPPLKKRVPDSVHAYDSVYSFGYDPFIDNYKVIVVSSYYDNKKQVSVHTLGTDHWRRLHDFPFCDSITGSGIFVSGNVNWLANGASFYPCNDYGIVLLNLEKESYKMIPQPDHKEGLIWELGVLRDCLCIFETHSLLLNVWVMKEYGKKESWTKLYRFPFAVGRFFYPKALYIFEDDQILLDIFERKIYDRKLFVYDSKNGNLNIQEFQSITNMMKPNVYIESLISP